MPSLIQRIESKKGTVRWRGRFPVGQNENGSNRYTSKTFDRRKDADDWVQRMKKEREDEDGVLEPSTQPLGEYLDEWLTTRVAMDLLRDRTAESYRAMVKRYIKPTLGTVPLCKLTSARIQNVYTAMRTRKPKPLSPRTVRYVHSILHSALDQAVKDRELAKNPARYKAVTLPPKKTRTTEINPLSAAQAQALLSEADGIAKGRYSALFRLALHTGMRPSELFGLTWQDIELDGDQPVVHVRKTLTWTGKVKEGSRRWTRAEPKTETARRTIDITPEVAEVLRKHRTFQRELLFRLDQRKVARGDLVFTTALYAPVELHTFRSKIFKKALKRAAESLFSEDEGERSKMLQTRLYDLRHTMATLWLSEGVPIKVVSERLGHADITTTLSVYAHVLPGMQRDAVQKVAKAIGL